MACTSSLNFVNPIDQRNSVPEIIRCDICGSCIVKVFCAFCDVNLCRTCIGTHVSSDINKCHTFISLYEERETTIFPRCHSHEKKICELHCRKCNFPVCTECIFAEQHEKHKFQTMIKIFQEKQNQVKAYLRRLEKDFYEKCHNELSEVEKQIADFDERCNKLKTEISDHGEEWCKAIKIVVKKLTSQVSKVENQHKETLNSSKEKLQQSLHKVQQYMEQITGILRSNNIAKHLNINTDFEPEFTIPPKFDIVLPIFSKLSKPEDLISARFGSLAFHSDEPTPSMIKDILYKPEVITMFKTRYDFHLYNLTSQSNMRIWTSGDHCVMKMFNSNQGVYIKSIKTLSGHRPESIAITKTGQLVYTDYHDRSVNILKNGKFRPLYELENWIPHGVCSTSSGHILVVMVRDDYKQSKVVRYVGFKEKQTIFSYKGIPLFSSGDFYRYITENKNLDICVSDQRAGAVVVVNDAGELRFRYTGHTRVPKNEPFDPRGIATDSRSNILAADIINHCVHIIDKNGQFIRYLDCGLINPWGLCTDENDLLFVAQYKNKNVVVISFMQ